MTNRRTRREAVPEPEIKPRERAECIRETRVGGVHYFPGDQVTAASVEEYVATGDFKKV